METKVPQWCVKILSERAIKIVEGTETVDDADIGYNLQMYYSDLMTQNECEQQILFILIKKYYD